MMKIHFYLRFSTKFGQALFISGTHPKLGNNMSEAATPMSYLNEEFWHYTLELEQPLKEMPDNIRYKYLLKKEDGETVLEWGDDRIIEIRKITAEEIQVVDTWNHAGAIENAFYTSAFQHVLLKGQKSPVKPGPYRGNTHIFKVKAPLLHKNEALCILGSNEVLGNWNKNEPLLMSKEGNWWTIKLNLSREIFPVAYKYAIYNTRDNQFVQYEEGNNRLLHDNYYSKKKVTIVHDGFVHLPNNIWHGAGVCIPVFSLRSAGSLGVGEFTDLHMLVDWAKKVGLKMIQILPVNDTISTHTWEDSYPYKAISAFALHPIYLNLHEVAGKEDIPLIKYFRQKLKQLNGLPDLDYDQVIGLKWGAIKVLYSKQKDSFFEMEEYKNFFKANSSWLIAYAAFCYLRDKYKNADFNTWKQYGKYNQKTIAGLVSPDQKYFDEIGIYYFVQYHLSRQLKAATVYAHRNGIVMKGDIPIGVNRFSCDAWTEPELFHMDMQAGAPPDDFAVKGQNWGFPTYNWDRMSEDGFKWWQRRFRQMSDYYDAFRIDHILGFFRIWSIPIHAVEGVMGHFVPAITVKLNEFEHQGIPFNYQRYCLPYITESVLRDLVGGEANLISPFLLPAENNSYRLKGEFSTQRQVEQYFEGLEKNDQNERIKEILYELISNVILFEEEDRSGQEFHFRIAMENTSSYKYLDEDSKYKLKNLYIDYFYRRQDDFWAKQAMHKLPALKRCTNMLVCGEDLGMVPHCVPEVMQQLGILSLEIQRMPKNTGVEFFDLGKAPYLSVVTPSTHDMSTIRDFWEEDRTRTQHFYNHELKHPGDAPYYCEPWINKAIVIQHLYSPAMWSIFLLQDLMGIDGQLRRQNPHEERINIPANPRHYWRYRMHINLEELLKARDFNNELSSYVHSSARSA